MTIMDERIARLEERHAALCADVSEIKADVREVRDAVVGARVGWRLLLGAATAAGAVAGVAMSWLRSTGKG